MSGKKGTKQLDRKEFDSIKSVMEATSISISQVSNIFRRAPSTIRIIRKAKDFDDYKNIIHSWDSRKKNKDGKLPSQHLTGVIPTVKIPRKYYEEYRYNKSKPELSNNPMWSMIKNYENMKHSTNHLEEISQSLLRIAIAIEKMVEG